MIILLDVDLTVGKVHVVGDVVHLQGFFQIIIQDTLRGILEIRSHEIVQIDGLIDGVCLIFGKEFHP